MDPITAEPLPNSVPAFSDSAGTARISVQTVDENQAPIVRSALAVMFSGHTEASVSPQTFNIPADSSQDFVVTVWDREHHNPLSEGTTITFAATLGTIAGETSVVLPDTRDSPYTSFTFRLLNSSTGPALVGPNRAKIALRPSMVVQQTLSRAEYASIGSSAETSRLGLQAAAARVTVTVTVTSRNGNTSTTLFGSLAP